MNVSTLNVATYNTIVLNVDTLNVDTLNVGTHILIFGGDGLWDRFSCKTTWGMYIYIIPYTDLR